MNICCKHCGFVGSSVQNEGGLVCARCSMELIPPQDPDGISPDLNPQLQACVKCRHQQLRGSFACEKCGLRFALAVNLPRGAHFDGLPDTPIGKILREHWTALVTRPNDEPAHFAFIDLCQSSGYIEFAGHCYRKALHDAHTQDSERWKHYQQRVLARAMITLAAPRSSDGNKSRLLPLFLLVCGGILLFGLAYLYYHWSQSSAAMLQNSL